MKNKLQQILVQPKEPQIVLPEWAIGQPHDYTDKWGEELQVDEWKEEDQEEETVQDPSATSSSSYHLQNPTMTYRQKNGWKGHDLIHHADSPVRILRYHVQYGQDHPLPGYHRGGIGTILTGIVHFTSRAESHPGFCHGGSMTSVLDDVIGWNAFLVTGSCRPWTGFTVQVHTNLCRPIPVDSILLIQARIVKIVRRKISIQAILYDPTLNGDDSSSPFVTNQEGTGTGSPFSHILPSSIHATAEGLVVMNKGVMPAEYDRTSTMSSNTSDP